MCSTKLLLVSCFRFRPIMTSGNNFGNPLHKENTSSIHHKTSNIHYFVINKSYHRFLANFLIKNNRTNITPTSFWSLHWLYKKTENKHKPEWLMDIADMSLLMDSTRLVLCCSTPGLLRFDAAPLPVESVHIINRNLWIFIITCTLAHAFTIKWHH